MKGKKKICSKCAISKHGLCSLEKGTCDDWIDHRATCRHCVFASSCIALSKRTGNFYFCRSFEKAKNNNDPEMFDDYEEYYEYLEEKKKTKLSTKSKKKKKDKGFISIQEESPANIKSPMVGKPKVKIKKGENYTESENPDLWSPLSIIEEVIASDYDPQAFALVDERDLPKSKNIISFITEPQFLNQPLYPRQYQILLDFFACYCPWCSDTKFIQHGIKVDTDVENIKDKTVLFRNGVCPECGRTRYDAVEEKKLSLYTTMALAAGQRSGKTSTIWFTSPAIIHEYLQMPNAVKFMKQLEVTEFHSTFVGTTYDETVRTVWSPMHKVFTHSPWYKVYHDFLDAESQRLGVELYKIMDSFVTYKHKGIMVYPSGPDFRKLRGKTRICVTGDSLVNTKNGLMRLGDKTILGKDVTIDENTYEVIHWSSNGVKPTVKVTTKGGFSFEATKDHILPVLEKNELEDFFKGYKPVINNDSILPIFKESMYYNYNPLLDVKYPVDKTVSELIVGDKVYLQLGGDFEAKDSSKLLETLKNNRYNDTDKNTLSYLAKFLAYVTVFCQKIENSVISFNLPNRELVDRLFFVINEANVLTLDSYSQSRPQRDGTFDFIIYQSTISSFLEYLGITIDAVNSKILHVPPTFDFFTEEYASSYLNTLLSFGLPWYVSTRKRGILNVIQQLGLKLKKVIDITGENWEYLDLNEYSISENRVILPIVDLKEVGHQEVFDITVETAHLFTANGIIVHNCGGIDEGAYFTGKDDSIIMNAWQVYDSLDRSFSTLRAASESLFAEYPWVPSAYGLYTSSTRSKLDFIMGLYKRSKGTDHIYGRLMSTWEFNPNMPRNCKFIQNAYKEDPVAADRDYGSNPPFGSNPFIKSPADLVPLLSKKSNVLSVKKYKYAEDALGGKTMYPLVNMRVHGFPSMLAIDAGYSNNSYAMALMHYIPNTNYESDDDDEVRYDIGISGLLEIRPKDGIPLSFPRIYDKVITPICENYNIVMAGVDRWQSIDVRQRIFDDFGIDTVQYSVNYEDFENHRQKVYSENLILPKLEEDLNELLILDKDIMTLTVNKPVSHLILQYVTSIDTGRTVTKGEGDDMTDDILRAITLGMSIMEDEDFHEMFLGEEETSISNQMSLGCVVGMSTGSNASNGGVRSIPGVGVSIRI